METAKTISKIRVTYPPLQDEFCKYGDKFEKIAHNEANGMYCYKRTPINRKGEPVYYEVFKAPKAKDENTHTTVTQAVVILVSGLLSASVGTVNTRPTR